MARERGEASSGAYEFFLGVHVNETRFDDFDRQELIWRMALVTEAGEVTPL